VTRPLIGIVAGPYHNYYHNDELIYGTLPAYTASVAQAGGLPVLISPNVGAEALRATYDRLDGVLLSGGGDIDPSHYGLTPDETVYGVSTDRDSFELEMVRWAYAENKPLFGICRGCQMMNVALGGTLYLDIPREYPAYTGINHSQWGPTTPRDKIAHQVSVQSGTRLAEALGSASGLDGVAVNSLHHQALRTIAPPLKVTANAEDGIVEGVEDPAKHFFLGVQWHPEELTPKDETMRALFRAFIRSINTR